MRARLLLFVPVVVVLALHARFLAGDALVGWDVVELHAPWTKAANPTAWNRLALDPVLVEAPHAQLFAQEGAPRWNPYLYLGERTGSFNWPFQSYPPARALYAALPAWRAKGVLSIAHLALAGVFMLLYLRWRGHSGGAALTGSLAFALSPLATTWLEASFFHTPIAPWAVLALWGAEATGRSLSLRSALLSAMALGGASLAGHPHNAALLYGLVAVVVVFSRGAEGARWPRRALLIALVLGAALAVGAARLGPMTDEFLDGARSATPWSEYFDRTVRLTPRHLVLTIFPDLLGHPLRGFNLLGDAAQRYANHQEVRLHWGVPVLVLALAGVTRRNRVLAVVAVGAVLFAFATPLARLLHAFAPGFGSSSPSRTLWLTSLLVPVLAAGGFDRLRSGSRWPLRIGVGLLLVAVVVSGLVCLPEFVDGFLLNDGVAAADRAGVAARLSHDVLSPFSTGLRGYVAPGVHHARGGGREALLLSPTLGPLLLLLGSAAALWLAGRPATARPGRALLAGLLVFQLLFAGLVYNPTSSPDRLYPEISFTRALRQYVGSGRALLLDRRVRENSLMAAKVRTVGGYGAMYSSRLSDMLSAAGCPPARQLVAPRALPARWRDALSVRALLAGGDAAPEGLERAFRGAGVNVYANPTALPRARVHSAEAVSVWRDRAAAVERIASPDFRPDREVALEVDGDSRGPRRAAAAPPPPRPARIVIDEPERVVVEVAPGDPRPGAVLVLADGYGAGWTARAGSRELEVLPADVGLRAVRLPAGFSGRVEFRYAAPGAWAGALVSVLAVVACAGGLLALRWL